MGIVGLCAVALVGCQRSGAPAPVEWGYGPQPSSTASSGMKRPPRAASRQIARQVLSPVKKTAPSVADPADMDIQVVDIQDGREKILLSQTVPKTPGERSIKASDLEIVELREDDAGYSEVPVPPSAPRAKETKPTTTVASEAPLELPRPEEKPPRSTGHPEISQGKPSPTPEPKSLEQSQLEIPQQSSSDTLPMPVPKQKPSSPVRSRDSASTAPVENPSLKESEQPVPQSRKNPASSMAEQAPRPTEQEESFFAEPTPPSQMKAVEEKAYRASGVKDTAEIDSGARDPSSQKGGSDSSQVTGGSADPKGALFSWPLQGKILKAFSKAGAGQRNDGVNIEGTLGDPVKAARQGQVVYVGNELHGFGHLILIKHDDEWMSAYAHLSEVHVQRGDLVRRGQIVGAVGSSGSVSHPQLHFEVRRHSQPVDPKRFLE